jgi:hypothetical protein
VPNTYQDKSLREAFDKGEAAARKRKSRASNPYFNDALKQAWNDGYDEVKVTKSKVRFL